MSENSSKTNLRHCIAALAIMQSKLHHQSRLHFLRSRKALSLACEKEAQVHYDALHHLIKLGGYGLDSMNDKALTATLAALDNVMCGDDLERAGMPKKLSKASLPPWKATRAYIAKRLKEETEAELGAWNMEVSGA